LSHFGQREGKDGHAVQADGYRLLVFMASPRFFDLRVPESTEPIVFASAFSLEESVERLRAVVVPDGFDQDSTESAMGTITADSVCIKHNVPWPGTAREPHFVGSFLQEKGVVLSGRFEMKKWSIRARPAGCDFVFLLMMISGVALLKNVLLGCLAVVLSAALVVLNAMYARAIRAAFYREVDWISSLIERTLKRQPPT
jgi:hypothetical protein